MSDGYDVAVVGAGPAGLAAAGAAARGGARVLLVDMAPQFGGQYWRHADERNALGDHARWHHGWDTYTQLAEDVRRAEKDARVTYLPSTQVWSVQQQSGFRRDAFVLNTVPVPESAESDEPAQFRAPALILCVGAYDRQLPVPGWTLPGVLAAGGVQAFVKTQGVSPGQRVLLAGTGPFLLSVAATVLRSGAEVVGICEANDLARWIPRGAAAALAPSKGAEGAEYVRMLVRHRVPFWRGSVVTRIHGNDRVDAVTVSQVGKDHVPMPGTQRRIDHVDVVGLGWGFVPQAELLLQLGAATQVDIDGSLVGIVDSDQQSSVAGLYLAGEIAGVAGAKAAVAEGRIAGRAAAGSAKQPFRDRLLRRNHRTFARAMHRAHPLPTRWSSWLDEETIVCRCEEVPWGRVRTAVEDLGSSDPRTLKGNTRTGMGWCQGRMCGTAAASLPRPGEGAPAALTSVAKRPLAVPVSFETLAGFAGHASEDHAADDPSTDNPRARKKDP